MANAKFSVTTAKNIINMGSGGKRKGSGSKAKYNEPTTTIAFRVPVSKVDELKDMVNTKLSEWSISK